MLGSHLFLELSKLKNKIKGWFENENYQWSTIANSITKTWLDNDVQDRFITRDLEWGTPVPDTK